MLLHEIKQKIHGVFALILIGTSIIIGFITILLNNTSIAAMYIFVMLCAPFAICYFYCRKCPGRIKNCGHVFPGKITKLFKSVKPEKYKFIDYFITVAVMLLLFGLPQYWLVSTPVLFVIFWLLIIFAVVEAKFFVCTRCDNVFCRVKKVK